ncbi:hypothetical protein AAG570_003426 [Ranatra chinensis]|uniref:Uncharacterized protein n=1 Tax=Ranatra chinensis TaxID=642074 RepID=A0ABD0Y3N1_9HEMI
MDSESVTLDRHPDGCTDRSVGGRERCCSGAYTLSYLRYVPGVPGEVNHLSVPGGCWNTPAEEVHKRSRDNDVFHSPTVCQLVCVLHCMSWCTEDPDSYQTQWLATAAGRSISFHELAMDLGRGVAIQSEEFDHQRFTCD